MQPTKSGTATARVSKTMRLGTVKRKRKNKKHKRRHKRQKRKNKKHKQQKNEKPQPTQLQLTLPTQQQPGFPHMTSPWPPFGQQ